MADREDLPPDGDQASSDEETVKGDREEDVLVELLEQERAAGATPARIGNGTIADRHRELLGDHQDERSDGGSDIGLPRRAGSPIDSLLSVPPDDSPSLQVCVKGYCIMNCSV
jgi:vacuolar protein sorting-associated protein 8